MFFCFFLKCCALRKAQTALGCLQGACLAASGAWWSSALLLGCALHRCHVPSSPAAAGGLLSRVLEHRVALMDRELCNPENEAVAKVHILNYVFAVWVPEFVLVSPRMHWVKEDT